MKTSVGHTTRQFSCPCVTTSPSESRSLNLAGRKSRPFSSSFGVYVPMKNIGHLRSPGPFLHCAPPYSTILHRQPLLGCFGGGFPAPRRADADGRRWTGRAPRRVCAGQRGYDGGRAGPVERRWGANALGGAWWRAAGRPAPPLWSVLGVNRDGNQLVITGVGCIAGAGHVGFPHRIPVVS